MSRTLLVIPGYPEAQERIRRHWPFFERAGCDIMGIGRIGAPIEWPKSERLIEVVNVGKNGYVNGGDVNGLLIGSLAHAIVARARRYSDYCIIENDAVFLGPLPKHPGGLVTTLGGHRDPADKRFRGTHYYHTPWWPDTETAEKMLEAGHRMRRADLNEEGFPDRFVGLMVDLYEIKVSQGPFFSINQLDTPARVAAAREAIAGGAIYVHGIKTEQQLKDLIYAKNNPE